MEEETTGVDKAKKSIKFENQEIQVQKMLRNSGMEESFQNRRTVDEDNEEEFDTEFCKEIVDFDFTNAEKKLRKKRRKKSLEGFEPKKGRPGRKKNARMRSNEDYMEEVNEVFKHFQSSTEF